MYSILNVTFYIQTTDILFLLLSRTVQTKWKSHETEEIKQKMEAELTRKHSRKTNWRNLRIPVDDPLLLNKGVG